MLRLLLEQPRCACILAFQPKETMFSLKYGGPTPLGLPLLLGRTLPPAGAARVTNLGAALSPGTGPVGPHALKDTGETCGMQAMRRALCVLPEPCMCSPSPVCGRSLPVASCLPRLSSALPTPLKSQAVKHWCSCSCCPCLLSANTVTCLSHFFR